MRIRIGKEIATVLERVDGSFGRFKRGDGTVVVELRRALYGCVESAQLWYGEISNFLIQCGYRICEVDRCLFLGEGMRILLFVDDIIATAKERKTIDELFNKLEIKYGSITRSIERVLSYLGMIFDFTEQGVVSVSMDKYIDSVLEGRHISRTYSSPAGVDIFEVDNDATLLSDKEQDEFHSTVAKLLYASKRARPDILLPVSFLTTRVRKATSQDLAKLERVIGYLKGGHQGLILGCGEGGPELRAYVDASHATHADLKGHSGTLISLGRGPIFASSTKQKTVARSSFEAEVNAVSEASSMVIWTQNLLMEMGVMCRPGIVYQDNLGTVSVLKTGKLTGRGSKHIDIRHLWIAEKVQEGTLEVKWIPTEHMLADILTKGIVGENFQSQKARMLGW